MESDKWEVKGEEFHLLFMLCFCLNSGLCFSNNQFRKHAKAYYTGRRINMILSWTAQTHIHKCVISVYIALFKALVCKKHKMGHG